MGRDDRPAALRALAALDDASRRRLYEVVCNHANGVTREVAAETVGISRKLAAFHLDRLVEVGLLVAGYESGVRTRQFGRPPKTYRRSDLDLQISIPERRPEALAQVLVDALLAAESGEAPVDAARRLAYQAGRRLGADVRRDARPGRLGPERALRLAVSVLAAHGFEPNRESASCVRLRNCPYLPMSVQATDLVCGMSHQHLTGLLDGIEAPAALSAVLDPHPGQCCVELRTATPPRSVGRHKAT